MNMTIKEKDYLVSISEKIKKVQTYINNNPFNNSSSNSKYWFEYFSMIKNFLGNFDCDLSFIACLMAKDYLTSIHDLQIDITSKSQSASGLDIDEKTADGKRVIAEIKTTIPYGRTDFGASQKNGFSADFRKLANNKADYKYLFVTNIKSFEIINNRYLPHLNNVNVVLLSDQNQGI